MYLYQYILLRNVTACTFYPGILIEENSIKNRESSQTLLDEQQLLMPLH